MPEDPKPRYFQVSDHVGVNPDGSLEPAVVIGLGIQVVKPIMVNDPDNPAKQIVVEEVRTERVDITPIDGTRIYEVANPLVAQGLVDHCVTNGVLVEIEPPTKAELRRARELTTDARETAGTHTEPDENNTIDNGEKE